MKIFTYNYIPETIIFLSNGKWRLFYEIKEETEILTHIKEETEEEETEEIIVYRCKAVDVDGEITKNRYEEIVSLIIRDNYSLDSELAILRQKDSKIEEFEEYNNFAEWAKAFTKSILGIE